MASVNKVIIVGNLGRDPEIRTFPSGDQVANVTIATTDRWTDKNSGERKEATEWHRVSFHGRLAEIAGQYLRKGSQVYVEGSLRTRKWTDQATGQDRYATEIRADTMQMLGQRQGGSSQDNGGYDENAGYGYDTQDHGGNQGYGNGGGNGGGQQRNSGGGYGGRQGNNQQQGNQNQGNRGGQGAPQGGGQQSQRRGPPDGYTGTMPNQQRQGNGGGQQGNGQQQQQRGNSGFDDMDDDIPF